MDQLRCWQGEWKRLVAPGQAASFGKKSALADFPELLQKSITGEVPALFGRYKR
jgi:hypothetical protein